jgi:tripartite-type tricarboxylate transporter receptor subunit TctC
VKRVFWVVLAAAAALGVAHGPACAEQAFPARPIKFVVPFAPGGATDVVARLIAVRLTKEIGQPVIVENRTGAAAIVGSEYVMSQPADGYNLLFVTSGKLISPYLYKNISFDPVKDFTTLALVSETPMVFLVPPTLRVKSVKELKELLLKEPGKHSYGSAGNGVAGHLTASAFSQMIGADTTHIPYRGESAAIQDLLAGRLSFEVASLTAALPFIESGKLVGLGVTHETRLDQLPNVPTMAESGFPELSTILYTAWNAIDIKRDTPDATKSFLFQKLNQVLSQPELISQLKGVGVVPFPPSDLAKTNELVSDLSKRMEPIVKASGAKVE